MPLAAVILILGLAARVPASFPCPGDCRDDGHVSIDELITGVNIALGSSAVDACAPLDLDGNGAVAINEIITAVNRALGTCFDATVALSGLPGPTDVVYDSFGIPHIYGPDLNSVAFAQGYVQAAHRFWQMDTLRRTGEGRLSEILGVFLLQADVTMRTLFTTRDGHRLEQAMWEHIQATDPDIAAAIEAYSAGVNAWLADLRAGRNGATLPPEYQPFGLGPDELAPWRPQDSTSVGRTLQWQLDSNILYNEMFYVEGNWGKDIWEMLDDAAQKDTVRPAPFVFVPVVSSPQAMVVPPLAAPAVVPPALPRAGVAKAVRSLFDEVGRTSPFGPPEPDAGSNNWVVAPGLSDSGFAMLASDPHLGLSNPPNWFLQQLDVASDPTTPVSGAAVPGLPGIAIGHNNMGAWGQTYTWFDVVDVYVETLTTPADYPTHPRTVLFNGQQVPVLRLEENFPLPDGTVLTYPIEVVPHHGPMLPDPNLGDGVTGLAATGMTVRWTGQEVSDDWRAIRDLMRAQNADDFRAALRNSVQGANPSNFLWADVHGDIAYSAYARLPQRPAGTVPYAPMPGTGEAEWLTDAEGNIAWLPEDQFPHAMNPPEGFLATANSDPMGHTFDNDPLNDGVYFAAWYQNGLREQRIQDMLSNRAHLRPVGAKITMADMSAYQYDTASLDAARLLPFLFAAAEARPELVTAKMSDAIARLRAWTEEKPGSPSCNVVSGIDAHELRADVLPRAQPVSDEERADAVGSSLYNAWVKQIWEVLPGPDWTHLWEIPWRLVWHLLVDIDQTDPAFEVYTKGPNGDSTMWDDPATPEVETRTEVLLGALSRALDVLEQKFGSADMNTWLWGRVHQVQFRHFFARLFNPGYDLGPIPAPGGFWTVNPAAPGWGGDATTFTFSSSPGPSQRLVVLLDPAGIKAVNILPGGQNGNPGGMEMENYNTINPATHYGDMIPGWINGEALEMRISRQDVRADDQRDVRYVPAEE
ncbi:MAG TPA: penicillin acylase family protein [Dehalococcoidia bacterium]|nr:penicillin acylase family protein [Dehalococcoidia bacterium]